MPTPRRYAIIGLSGRSRLFTRALLTTYAADGQIVALLDRNPKKMEVFNQEHGLALPMFGPDEFARLASETRPDAAIISTTDDTHHQYVIAALDHGIEAICEKPLTVDAEKVRAIRDAAARSSAGVRVTFNYRYAAVYAKLKELILDGRIGRPVSVDFNDLLDTYHGASYFKRWNRYRAQSGSLLVTKACHHFDLIAWWLGQNPVEVYAHGSLAHYGPGGAHNPARVNGRRCSTCPTPCAFVLRHRSPEGNTSMDEHLINFNNPGKNDLFGAVDGYYADRCIFDADIDTWDTFSVCARYDGGAMLSFSLNAAAPYEGYHLAINGTHGRIETDAVLGGGSRLPFPAPPPQQVRLFPLFEGRQTLDLVQKDGGHGGGDPLMLRDLFRPDGRPDPLGRAAGLEDGIAAVLVGIAARESLLSGRPVRLADLLG